MGLWIAVIGTVFVGSTLVVGWAMHRAPVIEDEPGDSKVEAINRISAKAAHNREMIEAHLATLYYLNWEFARAHGYETNEREGEILSDHIFHGIPYEVVWGRMMESKK